MLKQLEAAKRQLAESDKLIADQRQVVETFCLAGSDSSQAEKTLTTLQVTQEAHLAEIERIFDELDGIPMSE